MVLLLLLRSILQSVADCRFLFSLLLAVGVKLSWATLIFLSAVFCCCWLLVVTFDVAGCSFLAVFVNLAIVVAVTVASVRVVVVAFVGGAVAVDAADVVAAVVDATVAVAAAVGHFCFVEFRQNLAVRLLVGLFVDSGNDDSSRQHTTAATTTIAAASTTTAVGST